MCCGHCATNVSKSVKEISGVREVDVDLREGLAFISIDEKADMNRVINNIREKITDLGYMVGEIKIIGGV